MDYLKGGLIFTAEVDPSGDFHVRVGDTAVDPDAFKVLIEETGEYVSLRVVLVRLLSKENGSEMYGTPEAAKYLGVHPNTILGWRQRGYGPPFFRQHRKVLYSRKDLDSWLATNSSTKAN